MLRRLPRPFAVFLIALSCALAFCAPSHIRNAQAGAVVSGGAVSLSGDVTGPSNVNTVAALTGSAGTVTVNASTLNFAAGVSPTISQAQNATGAGLNATWNGQAAKAGSNANGGNITIASGLHDGTGSNGMVTVQSLAGTNLTLDGSGNATINSSALNLLASGVIAIESTTSGLFLDGTVHTFRDTSHVAHATIDMAHGIGTFGGGGSDYKAHVGPLTGFETTEGAVWILPPATARTFGNNVLFSEGSSVSVNAPVTNNPISFVEAGSNTIAKLVFSTGWSWGALDTAPAYTQAQNTTGAGVTMSFTAQAAKAASNTNGGDVSIVGGAGDGTGLAGRVLVSRLNPGVTVVGSIAGNTTLTGSQSAATLYTVNPSAGALTLRINRAPSAGEFAIVRDINGGGNAIAVGWATGTTINCPALASIVITGDGTNAVLILQGT